ncbi:MAG: Uma2 family endonuclease [Planctomycetota bacterium]
MATTLPLRHRWTRREYDRMTDKGYFDHKRVEMIYGIIYKKDQQSPAHAYSTHVLARILTKAFEPEYTVFQYNQIRMLKNSDPEPDVSVCLGEFEKFTDHPNDATLVVEVSHTVRDLAFSRTFKAALYARAGVKDYWIVNLMNFQIEVFREPVKISDRKFDYSIREIALPSELISPLAKPDFKIAVKDIFPRVKNNPKEST